MGLTPPDSECGRNMNPYEIDFGGTETEGLNCFMSGHLQSLWTDGLEDVQLWPMGSVQASDGPWGPFMGDIESG
jgi:hypothetical protein